MQGKGSFTQNSTSNKGIKSKLIPNANKANFKSDEHVLNGNLKKSDSTGRMPSQNNSNRPLIDTKSPRPNLFDADLSDIKGDSKSHQDSARLDAKSTFLPIDSPRIESSNVQPKSQYSQKNTNLQDYDEERYPRTDQEQSHQYNPQITVPTEHTENYQHKPTDEDIDLGLSEQRQNIERLREYNQKLKRELASLAKVCDFVYTQEAEMKQNRSKVVSKEHPELIEKQAQIKQQWLEIETLKNQINTMKKQLELTYDLAGATANENELRAIGKEVARLADENESLKKINKEQHKVLTFFKSDEGEDNVKRLMEELKKEKEEYKALHEQSFENEKILKKNHEKIVTLDEKARDIKFKIQQKKAQDAQEKSQASKKQGGKSLSHRGAKKRIEDQLSSFSKIEINGKILEELEKRLADLKAQKVKAEQKLKEDIKKVEQEKKEILLVNARLQTIIKEKEKGIRINNLRLKELQKLSRYNALKPLEFKSKNTLSSPQNRSRSHLELDEETDFMNQEQVETQNPTKNSKQMKEGVGLRMRSEENSKSMRSLALIKSPRSDSNPQQNVFSARAKIGLYSVRDKNEEKNKQTVTQDEEAEEIDQ